MTDHPTRIQTAIEADGQLARVVLDAPPGNVIDIAMIAAIRDYVAALGDRPDLKLLVFEGAGAHFSYGASVHEHRAEVVRDLLSSFHALIAEIERLAVPTAAVVRGQCLGGGLELAAWCSMLVAERGARLGLPEAKLGVIPPIGAMALPWRVGGARATQLILTGESLSAERAAEIGLADICTDDAGASLRTWFNRSLAPKSALTLRHAMRASRRDLQRALHDDLPALERNYLDELMRAADPNEGIAAFIEKRPPRWTNR